MNADSTNSTSPVLWRFGYLEWGLIAITAMLLGYAFRDGLGQLLHIWETREEYSHGYFIPLLSLFLVWQNKDQLSRMAFAGAWSGVLVVTAGLLIFMLGTLSTLYIIVQYAVIIVLAGLALSWTGWRGMKLLWIPLVFLVFMIPLPPFLYQNLSGTLQLVSSELGVMVIRWFGISVFLEGNVIDLGSYKLQVVEACSGLRYLFPLMSFSFICAYFLRAPMWQRVFVFLSSIPITVAMNSFRIGVIGVLVDRWGNEMAQGFLHDFEGWVVFMACVGVLIVEMWVLTKMRPGKLDFREVFGVDFPEPPPEGATFTPRTMQKPAVLAVVVIGLAAVAADVIGNREEVIPQRTDFIEFPDTLGEWQGVRGSLDQLVLNSLDLTDHILSNYTDKSNNFVSFYAAYYDSQRAGAAAHSPRACIPGGGWEIRSLASHEIDVIDANGKPMVVNRLEIHKGAAKQLVYYWFKQRERVVWSEYSVKWYLFWDSMTRRRTDGALIRLSTIIGQGVPIAQADDTLTRFTREISEKLEAYVPD